MSQFVHWSACTAGEMKFNVFLPSNCASEKVCAIYWLTGLTGSEENFTLKAGSAAFASAAQAGVALVIPDTSPRVRLPGDDQHWDCGLAASYYVNATQQPWAKHYQMYDYVVRELPAVVERHLPINQRRSIMGHSVGGHGALVAFLRNPSLYRSVSAFAPVCNPAKTPWGRKAFQTFLGGDEEQWKRYDACELVRCYNERAVTITVDQGSVDEFLEKGELAPESLLSAAQKSGGRVSVNYRLRDGYDHSYFFISTFIQEHIQLHAKALQS